MMAPFDAFVTSSSWITGVVSLLLGIGFGVALERSGFGTARKLTAQFYLYDMSVFKVMFTAIVTAMLLTFLGVGLGLIDFDRVWINPTYLGSQVVGGLVFGAGFVIGGYCPGTALVALANLKWDALAFTGGLFAGIGIFALGLPLYEDFWVNSGAMGRVTLDQWLGIGVPWVVLGVVVMALGCFVGAGYVERWMTARRVGGGD